MSEDRFFVGPDEDPDRYEVLALVGGGGEGTVHRARFLLEGTWQPVAVKTLAPPAPDALDRLAERLRSQVDLLRLLSDPGVVGVHDAFAGPAAHRAGGAGEVPRTLHLVMNWVAGPNLVEWRDGLAGPGAFHDVVRVLTQIAASLDHLASGRDTNGQTVVHGDVKPGNVIVTPSGQARLVDFGLARLAHGAGAAPVGGTRGYLAPEVLASGRFSPASDRYALGAVAYHLLTGDDPPDPYDLDLVRAGLRASPLLVGRPGLVEHVVAMLAADPANRPGSALAWARRLGSVSTTLDPADLTAGPPDPLGAKATRPVRRALVASGAAVVLAVAGLAAALAARGPGDEAGAEGTPVTTATVVDIPRPSATPETPGPPTSSMTGRSSTTAVPGAGEVLWEGPLSITNNHCVDLDVQPPVAAGTTTAWCTDHGDVHGMLIGLGFMNDAVGGPSLADEGSDEYATCEAHTRFNDPVHPADLEVGARLCLRTSAGVYALLRVTSVRSTSGGSLDELTARATLWRGPVVGDRRR